MDRDAQGREVVLDVLSRRALAGTFALVAATYALGWLVGLSAPPMKTVTVFDAYGCVAPPSKPVVQGGSVLQGKPLQEALGAERPCPGGVDLAREDKALEVAFSFRLRCDQFFFAYAHVQNKRPDSAAEVPVRTEVKLWRRGRRQALPLQPSLAAGNGTVKAQAQAAGDASGDGPGSGGEWESLFGGSSAQTPARARERTLSCRAGSRLCDPLLLARQTAVDHRHFRLQVGLSAATAPPTAPAAASVLGDAAGNVLLEVVSRSTAFAWYEGACKYSLLLGSLVALVLYGRRFAAVPESERMVEQRWVFRLLCCAPALDDAPYALQFWSAGVGTKLLSSLLQASFLAALLLFWLVTLGAVRSPPAKVGAFRFLCPKLALTIGFWLCTAGSYAWAAWEATYEPSASAEGGTSAALDAVRALAAGRAGDLHPAAGFALCGCALAGVYAVWLFVVIARTLGEVFTMASHYTVTFFFTTAVIACTLTGVVFGALSPVHDEAAEFVSFLVLFNVYIWVLAFFYAPTVNATRADPWEGATASRAGLLHDPSKFSIDDEEELLDDDDDRHDPSKFSI